MTLQCTAPATINVIEGRHGMYAVPCDTDCCKPDQFDCTQVMEQNSATEWEYLKVHSYCSLYINRTVMIGANDIQSVMFFRYNEVTK